MESSNSKKDYHKGKKVGVYLPEAVYEALVKASGESGKSMTFIIIQALEEKLFCV